MVMFRFGKAGVESSIWGHGLVLEKEAEFVSSMRESNKIKKKHLLKVSQTHTHTHDLSHTAHVLQRKHTHTHTNR